MENDMNMNILIPLSLATGAFNKKEAMLLVGYTGESIIYENKKLFMTLSSAINWNKTEAQQASGEEKAYRENLISELEKALASGTFQYTDELIEKWAKVFPGHAKKLIESKSKKVDPRLTKVISNAVKA